MITKVDELEPRDQLLVRKTLVAEDERDRSMLKDMAEKKGRNLLGFLETERGDVQEVDLTVARRLTINPDSTLPPA